MDSINQILNSETSKADTSFTNKQRIVVLASMVAYASYAIEKYRSNESKAIKLEAVNLFPAMLRGEFKLWLRKKSLQRASKLAQEQANIHNRKYYVIRATDIKYEILSTKDADHNKRIKVLGKNVGAMELTEAADFIAMPKRVMPVTKMRG